MHNVNFIQALAYHPPTNRLYGISSQTEDMYALSTTTGAATPVARGGFNIEGLVWDSRQQ